MRGKVIDLDTIYNREKDSLPAVAAGDPVEIVGRYTDPMDLEIAGFLSSQFAYGKIEVFKRFLDEVFNRMGEGPRRFVESGDLSVLKGLYYRFQKEQEIIELFTVLRRIVEEFGSIGGMVDWFYRGDARKALWEARRYLLGTGDELLFFFPKPLKSSPLKRWMLYFRWMVRKDQIDQGLWNFMDKAQLTIPLDTHIFKIGRCMGWTEAKTPTWKAASEITDALRQYCPEDPLKYDLFLCHRVGIEGGCKGVRSDRCIERCLLHPERDGS
jgi:uncharacterized protein (TIGR02757 family)